MCEGKLKKKAGTTAGREGVIPASWRTLWVGLEGQACAQLHGVHIAVPVTTGVGQIGVVQVDAIALVFQCHDQVFSDFEVGTHADARNVTGGVDVSTGHPRCHYLVREDGVGGNRVWSRVCVR